MDWDDGGAAYWHKVIAPHFEIILLESWKHLRVWNEPHHESKGMNHFLSGTIVITQKDFVLEKILDLPRNEAVGRVKGGNGSYIGASFSCCFFRIVFLPQDVYRLECGDSI